MSAVLAVLLCVLGASMITVGAWPLPPRRYFAVTGGMGLVGIALLVMDGATA